MFEIHKNTLAVGMVLLAYEVAFLDSQIRLALRSHK